MPRKLLPFRKTPEGVKTYGCWRNILGRCYDANHPSYHRYGGRGIVLQASWKEDATAFHEYTSTLPSFGLDMTLERLDNDTGYQEGNLRWVTRKTQAENRRKMSNNTSGTTGVAFQQLVRNGYTDTYALARWVEPGRKSHMKAFNVRELGLLPAFAKAVAYRQAMIQQLNEAGAGYTPKHGL